MLKKLTLFIFNLKGAHPSFPFFSAVIARSSPSVAEQRKRSREREKGRAKKLRLTLINTNTISVDCLRPVKFSAQQS